MTEVMKSIDGAKIEAGDYIVYATKIGDSAVLKYGRVVALKKIKPYHGPNSGASICNFDVQFSTNAGGTNIELFNRVLVIDESLVPSKVKTKLDEAYERKTAVPVRNRKSPKKS